MTRACARTSSAAITGIFSPARVSSEGERYPTDIIYVKTAECEGPVLHPTQKPVELGRYMVRTYTNPGDIVLDNTFGSGSFLVAALMEGRNFIGIEKNENVALFKREEIDYIQVARERLNQAYLSLDKKTKRHVAKENLIAEFEAAARFGAGKPKITKEAVIRKGAKRMPTIVRRNERSWAIELISEINLMLNGLDLKVKRAGGESTLSVNRTSMFPDVLL